MNFRKPRLSDHEKDMLEHVYNIVCSYGDFDEFLFYRKGYLIDSIVADDLLKITPASFSAFKSLQALIVMYPKRLRWRQMEDWPFPMRDALHHIVLLF